MFTKKFWFDALERAIKTAAQAVIIGLALGEGFNAFNMDWSLAGGFALGGLILSILTSVASAPFTGGTSASLVLAGKHRA